MSEKITPLWKSHYSLGKSILTLEDESEKDGPDSIFQIVNDNEIDDLYLVEDSMSGFLVALEGAEKFKLNLRFGLRMNCVNEHGAEEADKSWHKIILFALNTDGCHKLIKISSDVNTKFGGKASYPYLKSEWSKDIQMVVPYYDSFLMRNLMSFSNCVPDFSFCEPIFIKESNGLPFEPFYNEKLKAYDKYESMAAKSIYYKDRADFNYWQTFKCMQRKAWGNVSLNKPEQPHCCSSEFCFESYLDVIK
jgi:DNA polymerase III alpha subunit